MEQKSIYKKIIEVMKSVERVPKNGWNNYHKYNYATESDLTESIRPILIEAGLAYFSKVLEQERDGEFTKVKMEFVLADTDSGETLTSTYWGEGQDKGDKGLYKAYTGATKYFLMKTFLIPTGDDPEQDETPENNQAKQKPNKNNQSKQNGQAKQLTEKQINRLFAIAYNNGHDAAAVKKAIMKLYNKTQAQDLTKAEYDTLISRIESNKKQEESPVQTLPDGSVDPNDPNLPF